MTNKLEDIKKLICDNCKSQTTQNTEGDCYSDMETVCINDNFCFFEFESHQMAKERANRAEHELWQIKNKLELNTIISRTSPVYEF